MPQLRITIVGAGICGLASALALTQHLRPTPDIHIVEIRPEPSDIGGAVGLTPNAVRCLHHLGILRRIREKDLGIEVDKIELFNLYTGARLGEIDLSGGGGKGVGDPPLKGLRILRKDLIAVMTEMVQELGNVTLNYRMRPASIEETDGKVRVKMESGYDVVSDLLLGCDGIHSLVRNRFVDEERGAVYSGIAAVSGFAGDGTQGEETRHEGTPTLWQDTALFQSRRGSLLTTYFEASRKELFVAGIMETKDVQSREGWLAKSTEQEEIRRNVKDRFGGGSLRQLDEIMDRTKQWTFYPVYTLPPKGRWCTNHTMLLGDAAHAMPPQGESAGHALEDAILFARVMQRKVNPTCGELGEVFAAYQKFRRSRIDMAYNEASFGWDTQKDGSWFSFSLKCWLTTVFLWWTGGKRQMRYAEDVGSMVLE